MESFASGSGLYYNDAESARILELLRHLIQFGDEVLLLSGPEGSGRSAMLNRVVARASSQWQVCRIDSTGNADAAMVILRFARCLGINMARVDAGDLVALLQRHLSSSEALYLPVILIDDAQRLNDEALEALLLLAQLRLDSERRVRLLLAGDASLHVRLQQPRFKGGIKLHGVELQPYSSEVIVDYLKYRLAASGYGGEFPFTPKQLRHIESASGGWPGRINDVAREVMSARPAKASRTSRLLLLGMGASLLVAALVGVRLYLNNSAPAGGLRVEVAAPSQPTVSAASAQPPLVCAQGVSSPGCPLVTDTAAASVPPMLEQAEPALPPVEISDTVTTEAPLPAAENKTAVVAPFASRPAAPSPSVEPAKKDEVAATVAVLQGVNWLRQQPADNYTLQLMASTQQEAVARLAEERQFAAPLAIAVLQQEGKQLYLLLQGSYTTRIAAEQYAAQLKQGSGLSPWVRSFGSLPPLVEAPAALQGGAVKQATATEERPQGLFGAAWLWSRNPGSYTIQLYGAGSDNEIRTYLERNRPSGPLGMIKVERGGKPWYLLLSGEYPSSEAAAQAVAALSPALRSVSPWQRTFASLQDEMMNRSRATR